jgi:hypothetical protein
MSLCDDLLVLMQQSGIMAGQLAVVLIALLCAEEASRQSPQKLGSDSIILHFVPPAD